MRATLLSALGLSLGLSALNPGAADADTALLLVNDRYRNGQNLQTAAAIESLSGPLQQAGFDVIVVSEAEGTAMRAGLEALLNADEDARILVAMAGHFARSRTDSFLLGRPADTPNIATVGGAGLSLNAVMEVAASAPGRAIVLLAQERRRIALGAGLGAGIGRIDPPNGVSVIAGTPEDLADLVFDDLLQPGVSLADALEGRQGIRPFGFVSDAVPFLAPLAAATPAPLPTVPAPVSPLVPSAEEIALWNAAQELGTAAAYRAYLARFPGGAFDGLARQRISAIENDPIARAQAVEEALALTRDQRRTIQADLTVLGFDTRGVDGIFGSGTRGAIGSWQTSRSLAATGYVDATQIATLAEQARVRRAEIAEEERLAREAAEREDRAFWQISGQGAEREGAEAYLGRYPEGLFADQARQRLAQFDDGAWQGAQAAGTIGAFEGYLAAWPEGRHVAEARQALNALRGGGAGTPLPSPTGPLPDFRPNPQLAAQENALNLPPITRSILEQRLAAIGLNPGRIDGQLDGLTRNALIAIQNARGLDVTGYFNQATVARLLAESFGGILR